MKNLLLAFMAIAFLASCGMDPAENPIYKEAMGKLGDLQSAVSAQDSVMNVHTSALAGYKETLGAMETPDSAYNAAVNAYSNVTTKHGSIIENIKEKIGGYEGVLKNFLAGSATLEGIKEMLTKVGADASSLESASGDVSSAYEKAAGAIAAAKAAMESATDTSEEESEE